MANSVDPDQTAPSGAVWSGPTLFEYAILSDTLVYKILGHLPYTEISLLNMGTPSYFIHQYIVPVIIILCWHVTNMIYFVHVHYEKNDSSSDIVIKCAQTFYMYEKQLYFLYFCSSTFICSFVKIGLRM